jgi:hypothetical protein
MSEEINYGIEQYSIIRFLESKLDDARGDLLRLHIGAAKRSENIFRTTKLIQQYYKFMHRIEVVTELLEEVA